MTGDSDMRILFFDTEVASESKKLRDIGAVTDDGAVLHTRKRKEFAELATGFDFLCGHNIFEHDLKYVSRHLRRAGSGSEPVSGSESASGSVSISESVSGSGLESGSGSGLESESGSGSGSGMGFIDTLCLSPLLFPARPYHRLLKDDKLLSEELNNPVSDSLKARALFYDEVTAFNRLDPGMKQIYRLLLRNKKEFKDFFKYLERRSVSDRDSDQISDRDSDLPSDRESVLISDRDSDRISDRDSDRPSNRESVLISDRDSDQISDREPVLTSDRGSDRISNRESVQVTDREPAEGCGAASDFGTAAGYDPAADAERLIRDRFDGKICSNAKLRTLIRKYPLELAYCLALINAGDSRSAIAPWVSRNYPKVNDILNKLCNTPCSEGCAFCDAHFDIKAKLKEYFDYDDFRRYNGEPLQQNAVQAAADGKSMVCVFPTGGGKSLTFQLPALIAGEAARGLTVVISPLQSLMKDQVDNLSAKGIVDAVTINGSLNPVERREAIGLVENGVASILYIAPESLRSASIERMIRSRNVVRFVIDEAHCFSAWGQDFRVDYQYIGPFIRKIREERGLSRPIPVSCFTATAKRKVIADIREYFRVTCGIELKLFATDAARENLRYEVLYREDDEKKYCTLRELILARNCPAIVYVARTRTTQKLAARLCDDGIDAVAYHGKMDPLKKHASQDAFMNGDADVIVATTAFGMGIDKDDVGLIIHYNISSSLEDYVQEAGRAGRNPQMNAECFILFNENDLDKHFQYLNETKLSINEIKQIWKAVKQLSKRGGVFSKTPLEIAREAGWDEGTQDIETKVKASLMALEQAGYLERGRNVPHVYATGITVRSMTEASERINGTETFTDDEKEFASRVMSFLISRKYVSKAGNDDAESRIDYIAERLGLRTEAVMNCVIRLREEGLLDDSMDMSVHIDASEKTNSAEQALVRLAAVENFLIDHLPACGMHSYKELNSAAVSAGIEGSNLNDMKSILSFWMKRRYIEKTVAGDKKQFEIRWIRDKDSLRELFDSRIDLSQFIVDYLFRKEPASSGSSERVFSVLEIQQAYNSQLTLLTALRPASSKDVVDTLMYLKDTRVLDLDGGFLVLYNAIQVKRLEKDNRKQYRKDDYKALEEYYGQRRQQIHIVGEFARLMTKDYGEALEFVRDYFAMDYMLFVRKYFKGGREKEIDRSITPGRYNRLFDTLSPVQRQIIDDDESKNIVVAAGPGSGKTKVLVHKLASLLLLEDVKSEQLLMLTFSRAAATEFKSRLIGLIGDAAYYVDIKTFHSYCFDILGRVGSITEADSVVSRAVDLIRRNEADAGKTAKTVLVIDEAQDMDADEFALIEALMEQNDYMRVIAVGDDDQNIYGFRASDSGYMRLLLSRYGAKQYELVDNYRSDVCITALANSFASTMECRMKTRPIVSVSKEAGAAVVIRYRTQNLAVPVLENIRGTFAGGSCCVMTATNEEAVMMTGILNKNGYKARLIQSSDGFDLNDLLEIRGFCELLGDPAELPLISQDAWDYAVKTFKKKYSRSSRLDECLRMISAFDETSKYKYYSDFLEYISDSKLEDFAPDPEDVILVSTIHKAKGREFDSVYMLLSSCRVSCDDEKHVIYVGMTRARKALYIHSNTDIFAGRPAARKQLCTAASASGVRFLADNRSYPEPDEAMLQLTHRGVNLGYCKYAFSRIRRLYSGSVLTWDNGELYAEGDPQGKCVLKLSRSAIEQLDSLRKRGFEVYRSEVRFLVYWKGKEDEKESLIALPDIHLKKR